MHQTQTQTAAGKMLAKERQAYINRIQAIRQNASACDLADRLAKQWENDFPFAMASSAVNYNGRPKVELVIPEKYSLKDGLIWLDEYVFSRFDLNDQNSYETFSSYSASLYIRITLPDNAELNILLNTSAACKFVEEEKTYIDRRYICEV